MLAYSSHLVVNWVDANIGLLLPPVERAWEAAIQMFEFALELSASLPFACRLLERRKNKAGEGMIAGPAAGGLVCRGVAWGWERARRCSIGFSLAVLTIGCRAEPPARFENAVVILVDTLRQDRLSCYGYERQTSPEIDRLAREGIRVDGRSPTSWTKPASASLLTGLHPLQHQAIGREDGLSDLAETLPEALQAAGLRTIAVSGNGWVSHRFGFAQGFDSFQLVQRKPGPGPSTASEINKVAFAELDRIQSPFFLYVHYVDPHAPYDPPIDWQGRPLSPEVTAYAPLSDRELEMGTFKKRDPSLMAAARELYDGEIRFVDREIGSLLAALESRGLLRSTLVVVTSDHGEEWEDHGRVGHSKTVYREVVDVPLIFWGDGLPKGVERGTMSLSEVAPAICAFLGVPSCPGRDRESDGDRAARFLEEGSRATPQELLYHLDLEGRSALGWEAAARAVVLAKSPYRKEWFDLEEDPGQQRNLLERRRELGGARFADDVARLARSYNLLRSRALRRVVAEADHETARLIGALGYVTPKNDLEPRLLPHRVRPADDLPGGLLGWEDLSRAPSCVGLAGEAETDGLLGGWSYPEPSFGGRWTTGRATLYLTLPPSTAPRALRLRGTAWRPTPFEVALEVGRERLESLEVSEGGPFVLLYELPVSLPSGPAVVGIDAQPLFSPSTQGSPDSRSLGVFLEEVCLLEEVAGQRM